LAGYTVAVTAERRREELAALLERRGARVVHAPAIRLIPLADDAELLRDVIDAVFTAPFPVRPSTIKVGVEQGRVLLEGRVERRTYVADLTRLIRQVDGVVAVDNRTDSITKDCA
jgi:hypothetical protein